jgi:hypothetical protein
LHLAIRIFRVVGVFAGHALAAVIGTAIFQEELSNIFHAKTITEMLHQEYALSAIVAFALGYFVYFKWHSAPGKWICIAGVLWFTHGALSVWHARYSFATGEPSFGTVCYQMFGPAYGIDSLVYVPTLVRTAFYSIGAWGCWAAQAYGWSPFAYLKARLNALRGGGSTET